MKVKPIKVDEIDNANVNITFQILKNDGTLLGEITRGFTSTKIDESVVRQDIIESFKNVRKELVDKKASVLSKVAKSLLNQEIDIQ